MLYDARVGFRLTHTLYIYNHLVSLLYSSNPHTSFVNELVLLFVLLLLHETVDDLSLDISSSVLLRNKRVNMSLVLFLHHIVLM